MGPSGSSPHIRLNAPAPLRTVTVGGSDESAVRAGATERFAALLGHPAAVVLTASCTSALEASATAMDIGPRDEVVVPAFTFPTTAIAFAARGATVRFADVDADTGNLDPVSVAARLGPNTRAVVCVHYAGVAADVESLGELLEGRGIDLVEDAAQGLFGSVGGRPLGTIGRFGAISLHRTKNLSVVEGGVMVVNEEADVDQVHVALDKGTDRVAFEDGRRVSYEWAGHGSAGRMPEAAVRLLGAELDSAGAVQARRHAVWARYATGLADWAAVAGVRLPVVPAGRVHPAHIFHLRLPVADERDRFVQHCALAGVEVARHFGSLPSTTFGRAVAHPDDGCPVSHEFAETLVRLPLHHCLSDRDVDRVLEVVTSW